MEDAQTDVGCSSAGLHEVAELAREQRVEDSAYGRPAEGTAGTAGTAGSAARSGSTCSRAGGAAEGSTTGIAAGTDKLRRTTQWAEMSYSGNFLVVTTAVSPYADPSAFVEEGVPQDAEFMTNYPHLEVLARPNPRRFVDFAPVKAGAKLNTRASMRVTTPNRHCEIMRDVERSLRRLHCEQDAHQQKLAGGLHMQEVNVLRVNAADDTDSLSKSKYLELSSDVGPTTTADRSNLWLHVTHRDEGPSGSFQTPAQHFAFDLADARCHNRGGNDKASGVPWAASDPDLSRELKGPSAERGFPAHSRLFLDHIESNSDAVAEHQIIEHADALAPLTPSQVEVQKQLKERLAGSTSPSTGGPNMKLWDVKVELLPLDSSGPHSEFASEPYFVGVLIYSYSSPHYLLELDYGAFYITPPGSRDDAIWNIAGSVDGEPSDLCNQQVRQIAATTAAMVIPSDVVSLACADNHVQVTIVALDGKLCPFRQTGIHSHITMDRTEKASRVAAGALLRVVRDVWHEKRPRFQYGFVLAKPPTHHSTPNEELLRYRGLYDLDDLPAELQAKALAGQAIPNGYCHLNSMACAVAYLLNLPLKTLGQTGPCRPRKVVIFDIDVHLGDGTESTFFSNPDVPLSCNNYSSKKR